MYYEFQVLHKILPQLNTLHVPNSERIKLVGKTILKSLERVFLSARRTRSIIALTSGGSSNDAAAPPVFLLLLQNKTFIKILKRKFLYEKFYKS